MKANILEGKIAIVTGASRGIGKCIAEKMAQEGAIVYANVRKETEDIKQWIYKCNKEYAGEMRISCFDITDFERMKEEVSRIWKMEKKIDILVNNAGVEYNENIGMLRKEHMLEMFQVNVIAGIELTQLVARIMMRIRAGSIVNIASIVGRYGNAGQSVYSATKGAIIAFSKSAAKELGTYGIRVNAIAPGVTQTNMSSGLQGEFLSKRLENIPLKRMATPEEIAETCIFLCSDYSQYVSGQILGVDGGSTL